MRRIVLALIFPLLLCACVESRRDSAKRMETVSLDAVQVEDDFWTPYYYIHKDVTLPLCVRWTENHFDSTSVSKAVEGMAYSLMFENDPELKVLRGTWSTRLSNGEVSAQRYPDTSEVNSLVSSYFSEAKELVTSGDGAHADIIENVFFNKLLAGISLKGDSYFTDLPAFTAEGMSRLTFEETPSTALDLFRAIPSLGNYAYGTSKGTLWVNLFMGGTARVEISGKEMIIDQTTSYPWDGYMSLRLGLREPVDAEIRIRIPSWCEDFTITVNGTVMNVPVESGYALLKRKWQNADNIELILDMPVEMSDKGFLGENEEGKRIVRRGPIVYCVEDIDNPIDYDSIHLSKETVFTLEELPKEKWWGHSLTQIKARVSDEQTLSLIPYFAWGNRTPGKMDVFIPYVDE